MARPSDVPAVTLIALVAIFVVVALVSPQRADARLPLEPVVGSLAMVGPGEMDSFTVECGSAATPIQPESGKPMFSYSCQTPLSTETGGTTLVAVGDAGIADPALATRNSEVYSGDTQRFFGGNVRLEYCRADTGTVDIFCRAMVATRP